MEQIEQLHKKFKFVKTEFKTIFEKNNDTNENKKQKTSDADIIDCFLEEKNHKAMLYDFLTSYELQHFYASFISEMLDEFKDIDNVMKSEWDELKSKIINYTNVHTVSCLLMSCHDLFYTDKIHKHLEFQYSEYDKNILLWAFLLHDIGKYITFDSIGQDFYDYLTYEEIIYIYIYEKFYIYFLIFFLKNRKDRVHPYKSGVISVRVFHRINFLKVNEQNLKESLEKDIDQLCYFLSHSNRKEKYKHTNGESII